MVTIITINRIKSTIDRVNKICIVGKSATVDDVLTNAAAFYLAGETLRLLVLQYEYGFSEKVRLYYENIPTERTNRDVVSREESTPFLYVGHTTDVTVGDMCLKVKSASSQRLDMGDSETVAIISLLLSNGWEAGKLGRVNIDYIYATTLTFDGNYGDIPTFVGDPTLHMGKSTIKELTHLPLTLTVSNFPSKHTFPTDDEGGEEQFTVHSVALTDVWGEMEARVEGRSDAERKHFELAMAETCPPEMRLAVVEYSCENEDIRLQFYAKEWLDMPIKRHSSSHSVMEIIYRPDEPSQGLFGVVRFPIPATTEVVELELCHYSRVVKERSITLV